MTAPQPFLKWVGGKRKLLPALLPLVPERIETYYEPFLGGGALFWALADEGRFRRAVLSDVNVELVTTYLAIRDQAGAVLSALGRFEHTKECFEATKAIDWRQLPVDRVAARMIFLNRTAINGLYRVNRKGQFNAAFGSYKKMDRFADPEVITACSRALQGVAITAAPWTWMTENPGPGDVVYFDPPYVPVSATANFTGYVAGGFGIQDQSALCTAALLLVSRGAVVVASNSDAPWVRRNYGGTFAFHQVKRQGTMNSDPTKREPVRELIMRSKCPDAGTTARGESSIPNACGVDGAAAIPRLENDGKGTADPDQNTGTAALLNGEPHSTLQPAPIGPEVETSPGEQRARVGQQALFGGGDR